MPPVVTSLKVNNDIIELDRFARAFISSTVLGMLSALRGMEQPEELEEVKIVICGQEVTVLADGVEIGMNQFIRDFVRNTIKSMLKPLRGVPSDINGIELTLLLPLTNQQ